MVGYLGRLGLIRLSLRARLVLICGGLLGFVACITRLALSALTQVQRHAQQVQDQTAHQITLAGMDRQFASPMSHRPAIPRPDLSRPPATLLAANFLAAVLTARNLPVVRTRLLAALGDLVAQDSRPGMQPIAARIAAATDGRLAATLTALLRGACGDTTRQIAGPDQITGHLAALQRLATGPAQTARLKDAMLAFTSLALRVDDLLREGWITTTAKPGQGDVLTQSSDIAAPALADFAPTARQTARQTARKIAKARLTLVLFADLACGLGLVLMGLLCAGLGLGLDQVLDAAERSASGEASCDADQALYPVGGGVAGRFGHAMNRMAAVPGDIIGLTQRIRAGDLSFHPLRRCEDDPPCGALEALVQDRADGQAERSRAAGQAQDHTLRLNAARTFTKADALSAAAAIAPSIAALDAVAAAAVQPGKAGPRWQDSLPATPTCDCIRQDLRPPARGKPPHAPSAQAPDRAAATV